MLDNRVALREDGGKVEFFTRDGFSHTGNCLGEIEHLDRAKQCLARVAAEVVAFPTDQAILDQCGREAC
ncbi:hypothetical protein MMAGJ_25400 [Mycolicibacterium mageritense]|uniref:Uncharacterized protein n=1 Tax=Mycolicibacterium mageritense TaxID=53462 RepID=A0ABN5Y512_MYCME|nr:hypothetical protein MMAGJ_25400 [Mycolicibacterium mageritense]